MTRKRQASLIVSLFQKMCLETVSVVTKPVSHEVCEWTKPSLHAIVCREKGPDCAPGCPELVGCESGGGVGAGRGREFSGLRGENSPVSSQLRAERDHIPKPSQVPKGTGDSLSSPHCSPSCEWHGRRGRSWAGRTPLGPGRSRLALFPGCGPQVESSLAWVGWSYSCAPLQV